MVKMEADVLKSLKFEMGNPTTKTFLRRLSRVAQEDYNTSSLHLEFLGYYLAELSLLDYSCVKFLPSLVAASVIYLARFITQPKVHPWNLTLQQYSGYKTSDIKECVLIIHDLYLSRRGGALQANGGIPYLIGNCKSLEELCMENNMFSGSIPENVKVKGLAILDLSLNQLSGTIPCSLQSLQLLNLSFQNLEGPVPIEGIFDIFQS
ncbi:hypothetical protein LWI28_021148 [Acer negundo]|uniref:B-like cyclin n=1 Tax=Acer negundo TaxID=4023 RepID=A0AAD5JIS7_ACENE|nr:hypothetical protein LWI28_021148 [Acer negundo]